MERKYNFELTVPGLMHFQTVTIPTVAEVKFFKKTKQKMPRKKKKYFIKRYGRSEYYIYRNIHIEVLPLSNEIAHIHEWIKKKQE